MALRPCLGFGDETCGQLSDQSRCPTHRRLHDRARGSSTERGYDADWRRMVAALIAAEPWCHRPGGCQFPSDAGTPSNPLSGQHIRARIDGGTNDPVNAEPWCLKDNSADSASHRRFPK